MNFAVIMHDLKVLKGASTDSDLARKLKIKPSAVAQWRRRGVVPTKWTSAESLRPTLYADDVVWSDLRDARRLLRRACETAEKFEFRSDHLRSVLAALQEAIEYECLLSESREELSGTPFFKTKGVEE